MLDTENRTTFNENKSRLENLELLDQIHQDALRVFEDAGIKCDLPEVRRIFGVTGTVTLDK
jgi:trimethylamine:corrinoid methyltransferase-like protein